jgi:hypothetical protein
MYQRRTQYNEQLCSIGPIKGPVYNNGQEWEHNGSPMTSIEAERSPAKEVNAEFAILVVTDHLGQTDDNSHFGHFMETQQLQGSQLLMAMVRDIPRGRWVVPFDNCSPSR